MARISLLVVLLLGFGKTLAAEPFEFRELQACDAKHDAYGPDKLTAERLEDRLVLTGWAGMTCGEKPTNPQVLSDWGALTLRVDYVADGPAAACRCTSKFEFVLNQEVPAGRTVYLVKNGKGAAHVVAP